jgi:hypothetical protein
VIIAIRETQMLNFWRAAHFQRLTRLARSDFEVRLFRGTAPISWQQTLPD